MTGTAKLWVQLLTVVVLARVVWAQELGSLEWFKAQWAAAEGVEIPRNVYIEYEIISPVPGDEAELDRLAGIVEGKPDHPLRQKYDDLKWQIEHGPKSTRYRLWYGGPDRWRMSQDLGENEPLRYIDHAVDNRDSWQLTDRDLSLVDTRNPPPDRNPSFPIQPVASYLHSWVHPGMDPGPPLLLEPVSSVVRGDKWVGEVESPSGDRKHRLIGVVRDGRIEISSSTVVESLKQPGAVGWGRQYSQWGLKDFFQAWIAARVEVHNAEKQMIHVQVLKEIRPLRDGELQPLLQTPMPDGIDPIRGKATFMAINDFRRGVHTDLRGEDPVINPLDKYSSQQPAPRWLIWAGWGMVGLFVGGLVWFRLYGKT